MSALHDFPGGLKLEGHKQRSNQTPIRTLPLTHELILPLNQHIGAAAEPCVAVGDQVEAGQVLACAIGAISANVHAPAAGVVRAIEARPIAHVSGLTAPSIVLDVKPAAVQEGLLEPIIDWPRQDPALLRERIAHAGIVGMGGAGFPTAAKLNTGARRIHTLILNGAECEPYITCDDRLMREQAPAIVQGALIMAHLLHVKTVLFGVEDNKPEAIAALNEACDALRPRLAEWNLAELEVRVATVPTRYPAGGEKQLIYTLTGHEVPSRGLPADLGVVCHNMGTAYAVDEAILKGRPLLDRVVTVTGEGVAQPGNVRVALGTPIREVLKACGHVAEQTREVLVGGPMMGFELLDLDAPVSKTLNCLLVVGEDELPERLNQQACIRCGDCAKVCPVSLLPQQLYWHARAKDFDRTEEYNLFDCIECGCCAWVCPSNIPLVQYYRFAKNQVWTQEREREKSEHARLRHEFREARLERIKREREEKLAQQRAKVEGKDATAEAAKKKAIQEAIERSKQKKAVLGVAPKNMDNLTEDQLRQIAEADQRRAHKKPAARVASDTAAAPTSSASSDLPEP
jgi:electron transport complex protein RnfC